MFQHVSILVFQFFGIFQHVSFWFMTSDLRPLDSRLWPVKSLAREMAFIISPGSVSAFSTICVA